MCDGETNITLAVKIKKEAAKPFKVNLWELNAYQSPNLPHGCIPLDPETIVRFSFDEFFTRPNVWFHRRLT